MLFSRLIKFAAASAAVSLLAACATPQASTAPAAQAAPAGSTLYCHKDRLYTASGDMVCNWTESIETACKDLAPTSRLASSNASGAPTDSRLCPSGQRLVQVAKK
jgi:hypothetical protein